jgi:23S rRNA pseudouridine2605 synthase
MEAMGVVVNRLIRISYGPFRLNNLKASEVEEVKGRVLRDQLGIGADDDTGFAKKAGKKSAFKGKGKPAFKPRSDTDDAGGKSKRTVTRSGQRDFDRSGRVAPGKRAGSATRVGRMENPNGPKRPSKRPGSRPAKGPQGGGEPKGRR